MSSPLSPAVFARIVTELLEDAAFLFTEPASESRLAKGSPIVARLPIQAGATWELCVCVEAKLGPVLAANLLGVESDSGEALAAASDAVGELANILAGTVALELQGKDVIGGLGIPVVCVESGRTVAAELANSHCQVSLATEEGYQLVVALTASPQGAR